MSEAITRTRS